MIDDPAPSISPTVSSVTDLPIPPQKSSRDCQQKATPKTPPLLRKASRIRHRPQDDIEVQSLLQGDEVLREDLDNANAAYLAKLSLESQPHAVHLSDLPVEVQDGIIDNLAGNLASTMPGLEGSGCGSRNWSTAMRHPRRKQLSDLALVSKVWRRLIQERLYRHIKVKGTQSALAECKDWFEAYSHLQAHVRHLEIWIPIWEVRTSRHTTDLTSTFTPRHVMYTPTGNNTVSTYLQDSSDMSHTFQQASQNVTLEDVFEHMITLFPRAYALTIEGGQGKKTPLIRALRESLDSTDAVDWSSSMDLMTRPQQLPTLPNIGSLVLKGAWNIIRSPFDFYLLTSALPNLREYQCTYSKPKTRAYEVTCNLLQSYIPSNIQHMTLCLEGLSGKPSKNEHKWRLVHSTYHACKYMGRVASGLETFTYTGRICANFFTTAADMAKQMRDRTKLKSVDLIVRNCCRGNHSRSGWSGNDATGIYQLEFITLFRDLVTEAVRSLSIFPKLHNLRIRFLDLDSPNPLLNPYFHLQNNSVTGIWSDEILQLLEQGRPSASFKYLDLATAGPDDQDDEGILVDEHNSRGLMPGRGGRPRSINVDAYAALAEQRVFS